MKEIDKVIVASAIVAEWGLENAREQNDENEKDKTQAARAIGAMHALSAVFSLRGEDAEPVQESMFQMFAKGLAKAMNQEKKENDTATGS